MHEVAVTGWGIVAPLGASIPEFARRMFAGESGVVDVRGRLVARDFPVPYAAVVARDGLWPTPSVPRDHPAWKWEVLAAPAAMQAVDELPAGVAVDAVVCATAEGVDFDACRSSYHARDRDHFPWDAARSDTTVQTLGRLLSVRGHGRVAPEHHICLNNACISANQAVGIAMQRVRAGAWTRALVSAVDARCDAASLMNFHMLSALTTADVAPAAASRPFSVDRAGFVRGEGAAALLLESRHAAEARGAPILGFVAGYAASSDAYRVTDGRPDGRAVVWVMRRALRDARLTPGDVSAVSAHGTSTPMNDRLETLAIKEVFGERARDVPVTSLKSQLGHATVAAGAFEAVASLLMLRHQMLAPTLNFTPGDPDCDLDYVPHTARPARLETILSNSFGFGGQNACLVLRRGPA